MRGRNIFSLFFFFLFGGEGTQCAARILLQPCLSLCLHLLVDTFGGKPSYLPPPPPPMSPLCCTPNVWAAYLACCQVMCAGLHALAVWPSTGSVLGSSRKKTWVAEKSVAVHSKKFLKTSSVCERPGAEGLWWGGRGSVEEVGQKRSWLFVPSWFMTSLISPFFSVCQVSYQMSRSG